MEIDGIVIEEMPNNTLRFYMSGAKRRSAAMGNIGGFLFGLLWTGMTGFFFCKAIGQPTSTGQTDYTLLMIVGIFVFIGLAILYASVLEFLTETYGTDIWYASNNNLVHETSLWGKTSRKSYSGCQLKLDRMHDKNGAYMYSNLVAHSRTPRTYAIVDHSQDEQRMSQLGDVLAQYTGWGWDGAPPGQAMIR